MNSLMRNVWAEIDLGAIRHNASVMRQLLPQEVKLCCVVKANGYGHGAIPVAQTALSAGADYLAVAITDEAVTLRQAGITAPILILGCMPEGHAETVVRYNITQTVFDLKSARELSAAAVRLKRKVKLHLAVDTGMNRIGCKPKEAGELAAAMSALPQVELEGVFSHFALADSKDKSFLHEQYSRFQKAIGKIEEQGINIPLKHIANSAPIVELPEVYCDMVRQGITLYGLWPSSEVEQKVRLRPAMQVKTNVVYVKTIPAGETVGYGRTFVVEKPTVIATLPIGYADGLSRRLSNKGFVMIRGQKAPIVGRVCMDQIMVDVSDIPEVTEGDEVIVLGGKDIPMELVAEWMETISYEVICRISERVPRVYINN